MRAKYVTIVKASGSGVADRWARQYQRENGTWIDTELAKSQAIHQKLCALGDNPKPRDVADIIGNKSWSFISCDGCSDYVEVAVEIGQHETHTFCATCIDEASAILSKVAE